MGLSKKALASENADSTEKAYADLRDKKRDGMESVRELKTSVVDTAKALGTKVDELGGKAVLEQLTKVAEHPFGNTAITAVCFIALKVYEKEEGNPKRKGGELMGEEFCSEADEEG